MSNLIQLGENVRNLAKQYRSVIELGAELERIGTLENREAEILKRIEVAQANELAAKDAEARAVEQAGVAEQTADKIVKAAKRDAEDVVARAKAEAAGLASTAQTEADDVLTEARKQASFVQLKTLAAEAKLQGLNESVSAAEAKLESAREAFEALRAKMA